MSMGSIFGISRNYSDIPAPPAPHQRTAVEDRIISFFDSNIISLTSLDSLSNTPCIDSENPGLVGDSSLSQDSKKSFPGPVTHRNWRFFSNFPREMDRKVEMQATSGTRLLISRGNLARQSHESADSHDSSLSRVDLENTIFFSIST